MNYQSINFTFEEQGKDTVTDVQILPTFLDCSDLPMRHNTECHHVQFLNPLNFDKLRRMVQRDNYKPLEESKIKKSPSDVKRIRAICINLVDNSKKAYIIITKHQGKISYYCHTCYIHNNCDHIIFVKDTFQFDLNNIRKGEF